VSGRIEHRARFDAVRYANCWEDADVLCEALPQPLEGRRILSIASAGDNALALAAEGAEVVVTDLSFAQLACLELRRAAFRNLDHDGVLRFLGVEEDDERLSIFDRIAMDLPREFASYWNAHREAVAQGIIHAGRFEKYVQSFRRWILPLIHSKESVRRLMNLREELDRHRFYEEEWDSRRWRLLFRVFFSRLVMGRLGRDPEFFRYVEESVSEELLSRIRCGLTKLPTQTNPYLHYLMTGNFGACLPRYLERDRFEQVRGGLERITIRQGPIEAIAESDAEEGFDGFNLSDIFEYSDVQVCREVYARLLAQARPGARFVYWNMLVPRKCPAELAMHIVPRSDLARSLYRRDRAFFYRALIIEEVR
jgi:S-adenosylmethionine-diacylglycerol 3-amino-3-carboxypropyl transferase